MARAVLLSATGDAMSPENVAKKLCASQHSNSSGHDDARAVDGREARATARLRSPPRSSRRAVVSRGAHRPARGRGSARGALAARAESRRAGQRGRRIIKSRRLGGRGEERSPSFPRATGRRHGVLRAPFRAVQEEDQGTR
jgi:hypothetical protein